MFCETGPAKIAVALVDLDNPKIHPLTPGVPGLGFTYYLGWFIFISSAQASQGDEQGDCR
jgi:hypothetical protein